MEWIQYVDLNYVSGCEVSKKLEMGRSLQYLTTDIICRLCFGHPFGFVRSHNDVYDFLKTLESRLPIVEQFSVLVEFSSLLSLLSSVPWIKRKIIPTATDSTGIGKIVGVGYSGLSSQSNV